MEKAKRERTKSRRATMTTVGRVARRKRRSL